MVLTFFENACKKSSLPGHLSPLGLAGGRLQRNCRSFSSLAILLIRWFKSTSCAEREFTGRFWYGHTPNKFPSTSTKLFGNSLKHSIEQLVNPNHVPAD